MEKIRVVPYTGDLYDTWNGFVEQSNNGTLFHRQDFLAYHPADRFRFHHLMFFRGDTLLAVLPGGLQGTMYKSPVGSSLGGFVINPYLGIEDGDALIKAFVRHCAASGINEIYLTPPMQVYYRTFDEVMEYSMHYNHFITISSLYSSVIDFSRVRSRDDLSRKTRNNIKRSEKAGVRIEKTDDLGRFYPIILKNKEKFGTAPTHTLEELLRIEKLVPGSIVLFMAYYEDEPVAGQLLFVTNRTCILNFYTMHLYEYRRLNAVSLLMEYAVRWCAEQGFKYYDYGVSADTFSHDPMEPSWSLIQFKESFRATGCQRKFYYRRVF